jgi:hypothetical protein
MDEQNTDTIVGCTDGFRAGYIEGWAWRPDRPHDTVVVQLYVDGQLTGEMSACLPRPDLSTAGIGHGQHAFAIPLIIQPDSPPVLHLTVRAKDGPVLTSGEIEFATSEETRAELASRRSVGNLEKVFGVLTSSGPQPIREIETETEAKLNFVLYARQGSRAASAVMGAPEYSYVFVMHGFRDLLRQLGIVHIVQHPSQADEICQECLARGESCLLFSFTPPQNTPLGLRCPTIPVIAWEFGSIPTGGWPGDPREDWRFVLRQTGRAITISGFASRAIRATMGASYPAAFVPTPVWDRMARQRDWLTGPDAERPGGTVTIAFDGFSWDSRCVTVSADMRTPPPPVVARPAAAPALPMRGAQLALAIASAAKVATHSDVEVLATHEVNAPDTDRSKTIGHKARITARLARQWYREVIRDSLPRFAAHGISSVGRAVLRQVSAARRAGGAVPAHPTPHLQEPEGSSQQPGTAVAASADEAAPVRAAQAETTSGEASLPPTARYLPLGDPAHPEPSTAPPRYLPAPDQPPLPEPELADFIPDPYPPAAVETLVGARVTFSGLVFTSVLSPKDGRKNWQDILTAFCTVFREVADATLVLKIIGSDPAFWWWEFHDIVKALSPFSCRVLVINGFLDDQSYTRLIGATHFVVNASLAEGQCLPLVEFMSAGRPAIAPLHTAMLDYITRDNALIVASDVEFCSFPHDPRNMLTTTRHRIAWPSLCDAFAEAASIVRQNPARYASMSASAAATMKSYCSDQVAGQALADFLGFGDEVLRRAGWQPKARATAEPLLEPASGISFKPAEMLS